MRNPGAIGLALLLAFGQVGLPTPSVAQQQYLPKPAAVTLAVSSVTAETALPAGSSTLVIANIGTVEAFVVFGTTNAVVATSSGISIPAGVTRVFAGVTGATTFGFIAAISPLGTTTLRIDGGAGAPAGWGGIGTGSTSTAASPLSGQCYPVVSADGVTDDLPAVQACDTYLAAKGGGTLVVGSYVNKSCFNSGTYTPSTGVLIKGAGNGFGDAGNATADVPSVWSSCGHNTTVLNLSNPGTGMDGVYIDGNTFGSTVPALITGSPRVSISNSSVMGGAPSIQWGSSDGSMINVRATRSYGTALVSTSGFGYTGIHNFFDVQWVCTPTGGSITSVAAWTANTLVANCAVLSALGPDGNTYYIQVLSNGGGTTGSSSPTLLAYKNNISDGTATERLVAPAQPFSLVLANNQIFEYETDHTGAGVGLTIAGGGGDQTVEIGSTFGSNFTAGIDATASFAMSMFGGAINGCVNTGCSGIKYEAGYSGDSIVDGVIFWSNPIGINVLGGANYTFSNNHIFAASTAGIEIASGISSVSITGGVIGTSTNYTGSTAVGVLFNGGSGDNINLKNVSFAGATLAINGTLPSGVHNSFESSGALTLNGGFTVNQNAIPLPNATIAGLAGMNIFGLDATNAGITAITFGAQGNDAFIRWGGTAASPSAIVNGNTIGQIGWTGATSASTTKGSALLTASAAENWSTTAYGSYVSIFTTVTGGGSPSRTEKFRFQASGGLSIGNANITTDGGAGIAVATGFQAGSSAGLSHTCVITATQTLIFIGGILTGGTC